MVALLIALAVVVLCGLAELLHALRCRRVAYLAFGQGPAPWWLVASAACASVVRRVDARLPSVTKRS